MTIPDRLPIMRMEDYHTHYLGQASDGRLFWAYQTYLFTRPYADIAQHDNWQRHRKEYAVLHTFDKDGNYLATKYWCAGSSTATDDRVIEAKLREFVSELGETIFTDIEIKLFQTKIDDFTFGLVIDVDNNMINLQPSSTISFREPWDGDYYT